MTSWNPWSWNALLNPSGVVSFRGIVVFGLPAREVVTQMSNVTAR
ncbi:hypothetical protein [Streptomyces sp. NPDC059928]